MIDEIRKEGALCGSVVQVIYRCIQGVQQATGCGEKCMKLSEPATLDGT
jgi:hypothetical protein